MAPKVKSPTHCPDCERDLRGIIEHNCPMKVKP